MLQKLASKAICDAGNGVSNSMVAAGDPVIKDERFQCCFSPEGFTLTLDKMLTEAGEGELGLEHSGGIAGGEDESQLKPLLYQ